MNGAHFCIAVPMRLALCEWLACGSSGRMANPPAQCAGNRRLKDVLEVVFAYIALLKGPGGVSQQIFEENRQLARLRFDFRDKPPPMQLAEALASSMQTHDDRRAAVEQCSLAVRMARLEMLFDGVCCSAVGMTGIKLYCVHASRGVKCCRCICTCHCGG